MAVFTIGKMTNKFIIDYFYKLIIPQLKYHEYKKIFKLEYYFIIYKFISVFIWAKTL